MHVIGRKGLFLHREKSKGEMLEWLKRHAWKACIPLKGIPGSNPGLSAGRQGSKPSTFEGVPQEDWVQSLLSEGFAADSKPSISKGFAQERRRSFFGKSDTLSYYI